MSADNDANHQSAERISFAGAEVYLFPRWNAIGKGPQAERFVLRLKDFSPSELSGLSDVPLGLGDVVFVQLEETLIPAAEVVWFRHALVGLHLKEPLSVAKMQRLRDAHEAGRLWSPAMRARSDLPGWWTDIGEHKRGRRAVRSRN